MVEDVRAGEPRDEVRHRLVEARRGARLGRVTLEPAHLRRHVSSVERDPGDAPKRVGGNDVRLGPGTPVHPDQARGERAAVVADREAAVELAGDAQRVNVSGRQAGGGERLGDGGGECVLPQRRRLIGPAGAGIGGLVIGGGVAENGEIVVGDDDLEALRADIDADDGDDRSPRSRFRRRRRGYREAASATTPCAARTRLRAPRCRR